MPIRNSERALLGGVSILLLAGPVWPRDAPGDTRSGAFSMAQMLHYPFIGELAAAEHGDIVAWVRSIDGVRNIWIANAPAFLPQQITRYGEDDGQEITQLTFSPDVSRLVFVRGGDHDENYPAAGNLAPNPASSSTQPGVALWSVPLSGGAASKIDDGDEPVISARGELAYLKDAHVWHVRAPGGLPELLFFDRGKDGDLHWSPDGSRLAFVSDRDDHSFIGVFSARVPAAPLQYLAPSTHRDSSPRWSPDGTQVAFVRRAGDGGAPDPILVRIPHPWSLWVASTADGAGRRVWQGPNTLSGSFPEIEGSTNLFWCRDRLVFTALLDDWPHVYSVPVTGGAALLLTPGAFMVEHVTASRDGRYMIYDANTGNAAGDDDRRHLFRVAIDHPGSIALTSGETLDWSPVTATGERIAFISAGAKEPPSMNVVDFDGTHRATLAAGLPANDFPLAQLVVPKRVTFKAADGLLVHGQLFDNGTAHGTSKPGIIFVHGGPSRQMLLGWHYMDYYSNAYAVNQYLAAHGFIVLSVNYRLGIGYGRVFFQPEHAGFAGASEYQDVVAGAHFLQGLPAVDPQRIGIWGGSYGGYLTALALARDSSLFKAGVDLHGVHDWSRILEEDVGKRVTRYEQGDRDEAMQSAWQSSPDASISGFKSPVLLIQGDDDRNVPFQQTVDLAQRLDALGVQYEEMVLPNEIHGFLRHASWLKADTAIADFFTRKLNH